MLGWATEMCGWAMGGEFPGYPRPHLKGLGVNPIFSLSPQTRRESLEAKERIPAGA